MALSGTMSNPNDWLQFYNLHNNTASSSQPLPLSSSLRHVISGQNQDQAPSLLMSHQHDTTVVSTTVAPSASSAPLNPSSSNNVNNNNSLSPEGRVSKPVQKRTRASRRTPTTLLNTDTANFRAMVQQFTGGPTTASTFAPQPVAAAGFGFRQQGFANNNSNPNIINAPMMMPPLGFNNNNHQQQSPYMISSNNNNSISNIIGDQNLNHPQGFVGRLMSSQTIRPVPNMGVSFSGDEFSSSSSRGQGQPPEQASMVGSGWRPNSNDSNENRSNSFLY